MPLLTSGQIEKLRGVVDREGEFRPPANADEQAATNDRLGNHDSLSQFVYETSGTGAEALDSKSIPEGVTVLVEYKQGNSGTVYVGDSETQESPLTAVGQSLEFGVIDTSIIHVRTPTAGDGVVVTFEGGA